MRSLYVAIATRTVAMKNNNELSRRDFLLTASAISGPGAARLSAPALAAIAQTACTARDEASACKVLSSEAAAAAGDI